MLKCATQPDPRDRVSGRARLELNYFYDGETLFADTLCLSDNYPDGTAQNSTIGALYNNGLIAVQYLLPLMILSCAYYRVGVVLRKNQAVGDSRHAKSIAAKRRQFFALVAPISRFFYAVKLTLA
ncbi:hypothetical protein ANCDUO_01596 [Ancylostoma duodenale]|uniref:G-protein coupled receptors family 1 profile domain-containing protein n=1 Tax=Ancylostoma duodenale TaxID=51022 RepID=A0A0C2HEV4_9BILA|nr:hypothetical protein ANCDUO_01596 [Ancylostoma duodenale]